MPTLERSHKHSRHKKATVSSKWHNLYGRRWQRYRLIFLQAHPLCECNECVDKVTPATIVDHITDHRGDKRVFWDANNHQAMAKPCHDKKTNKTLRERGVL